VNLRKDMWQLVERLRANGVTIILTTHYIEEAEEIADRIGVINHGQILLVEEKKALMAKLGRKQMTVELAEPVVAIPDTLTPFGLALSEEGTRLVYEFDASGERTGISSLLAALSQAGLRVRDISTEQSSLEDIFVELVGEGK
jgi:ABC-2 type transport system ATP-binding protein